MKLNIKRSLLITVVVCGLVSGPWSLESASLSQPPIQWSDIPFIFFGCLFSSPLVLGFQILIGNLKAAYSGWRFFVLGGLFFLATGVSAFATSLFQAKLSPEAFLFFTIGAGTCLATLFCKYLFSKKWSHLAHPTRAGTEN